MPAEKSPNNNNGSRFAWFLVVLMLITGAASFFYKTAGLRKSSQAAATTGESVIQAESPPMHAEGVQENYVPRKAASGADAAKEPVAVKLSCAPAEAFELFYANFKADEELRFARTRFPLLKRVFSGAGEEEREEVFEIQKEQILSREEMVYLDTASAAGYSEGIFANDPSQIDIRMGPEDADPLTIHKFEQEDGCWFLYEFISYEYSGSNNILAL